MSPNEHRTNPFTETLPTALPFLPAQPRPVDSPAPSDTSSPSVVRIAIAICTLGLSIPLIGIRRQHSAEYDT